MDRISSEVNNPFFYHEISFEFICFIFIANIVREISFSPVSAMSQRSSHSSLGAGATTSANTPSPSNESSGSPITLTREETNRYE
jgi:hypothetical protein